MPCTQKLIPIQRIMSSGGSKPSASVHGQKKRHGSNSLCPKKPSATVGGYVDYNEWQTFEPNEDVIPNSGHEKLGEIHCAPRVRILDSDGVHDLYGSIVGSKTGLCINPSSAAPYLLVAKSYIATPSAEPSN